MGLFSNIVQSVQQASAGTSSVLGIDIGSSAIKVVELEERDEVLTLVTYGEVQVGPYAEQPLGSAVTLTPKQEQQALVDVVRESAVKSRNAVFAMPLSSSFISSSAIPAADDVDLAPLVRAEAKKLIPISLNEVTLDWVELEAQKDQTDRRPVLLAAIQNSTIERFNILMQFTGFGTSPTEIECFSTNRSIPRQEHMAVIDFGATSTKLYLSRNGILTRMHRINVGGEQITEEFAKEIDLPFEEAELAKLESTPEHKNYALLQKIHTKHYSRAMREFRQVFEQYKKDTGAEFSQIQVCGGVSLFAGLRSVVQDSFMLEVTPIDPFKNVAYPAFMEDVVQVIGPSFVPALGAALRVFE